MFKAKIYKVGINPVVKVPASVTKNMKPVKGYIRVTGTINGYGFKQTLVPVKDEVYRLFVNAIMLKGGKTKLGDTAEFTLKQNFEVKKVVAKRMHPELRQQLVSNKLLPAFSKLSVARKRELLNYLARLKEGITLDRNIAAIIYQLKEGQSNVRIPHPEFTKNWKPI